MTDGVWSDLEAEAPPSAAAFNGSEPDDLPATDLGNARRLVRYHGQDLPLPLSGHSHPHAMGKW